MRTCKWLLAAGTLTTLASVVAADIFKCTDEGGRVTFNDRGCASTERSQKPVIVVSVVSRAELTPGEQQTLADVIHRQRLQRVERARRQRQGDANHRRQQADLQKNCARAVAGLEEVRVTRRRGYSLSQADAIAERERSFENLRAETCP
jgi:hypothetical protein